MPPGPLNPPMAGPVVTIPESGRGKTAQVDKRLHKHRPRVLNSNGSSMSAAGWTDNLMKSADYGIADWDGNMVPPDAEWDSRPAFRDNQSEQTIRTWIDNVFAQLEDKCYALPLSTEVVLKGAKSVRVFSDAIPIDGLTVKGYTKMNPNVKVAPMGEIVPRYWQLPDIEGKSARAYWRIYKELDPYPADQDVLASTQAWWDLYPDAQAWYLLEAPQPPVKGIRDDMETIKERRLRKADHGSNHAVKQRRGLPKLRGANASRGRGRRGGQVYDSPPRQVNAGAEALPAMQYPTPDPDIIPKAINLGIRPAHEADLVEIVALYNDYIANSTSIPNTEPITLSSMRQILKMNEKIGLPFLVAVAAVTREETPQRTLVGMAWTTDYGPMHSAYRFTTVLHLYVAREHQHKSIGLCLLDQILHRFDDHHQVKTGYDVLPQSGWKQPIVKILVNMTLTQGEDEEWKTKWLMKEGFKVVGTLDDVGVKFGKPLGVKMLQRATGVKLPEEPPVRPW